MGSKGKKNEKATKKVESSEESSADDSSSEVQQKNNNESSSDDSSEEEQQAPTKGAQKRKLDAPSTPDAKRIRASYSLFIGNLPFQTTEDEIREFFTSADVEVVSVRLMKDNNTGRPKGFGYADFESEAEMEKGYKLSGGDVGGRAVNIDYANAPANSAPEPSTTVYVGNLSFDTNEDSLQQALEENGVEGIKEIRLIRDGEGGSKGFAYVEFEDTDSATVATKLHGLEVDGRNIRINFEQKKTGGDRGGRGGRDFGGRGGGRGRGDFGGRGGGGRDFGGRGRGGDFGGGRGGFRGGRGGDFGGRGGGRGFGGDRGGRGGRGGDRGGRGGFSRGGGRGGDFQGKKISFD